MTKAEFMEGIKILQNNYQKTFTIDQLKLFYENLKDITKERFINNIKAHIKISPYMPNIAELRNEKDNIYSQRNYSKIDFNQFYINMRRRENDT